MRHFMASAGLAALMLAAPATMAQDAAQPAPAPEAAQPSAMQRALQGFHVAVLEDQQGGMASVQNAEGNNALIAFLEPAAAEAARQSEAVSDMSIGTTPLLALLNAWDGPVVFEGSETEIGHANQLNPEAGGFGAPVFIVLADGKETMIDTGSGAVTPILSSYDDASGMADNLKQQGMDEGTIEIVPIEFGAILQGINSMDPGASYRIYTHPRTVAAIQPAQPQAGGTSQQ